MDTPPAIFQGVDLEQLAFDIKATIEKADQHATKGAAMYREAGQKLLEVKSRLKHGQLGDFVRGLGISERQARKYMQLAKTAPGADLDEQWSIICGHGGQVEDAEEDTSEREPGEEPEEAEDSGPKPAKTTLEKLETIFKPAEKLVADLELHKPWKGDAVVTHLQEARKALRFAALKPDKPYPDPVRKDCKYCGAPILLVQTQAKRKWMAVDAEPGGGQFELIHNAAVMAEYSLEDASKRYRRHFGCQRGKR